MLESPGPGQLAILTAAISDLPQRLFRGSWKMKEHLDAVTSLFHEVPSPLNTCALRNRLEAFLLEVVQCGNAAGTARREVNRRSLAPVLAYIAANIEETFRGSRFSTCADRRGCHSCPSTRPCGVSRRIQTEGTRSLGTNS